MIRVERPRRLIGYLLKDLDRLIEDRLDADLRSAGLSRRHWQALNTLAPGPLAPESVEDALAPFWVDDSNSWDALLQDMIAQGWVQYEGDDLALAGKGKMLHGRVLTRVQATRGQLVAGISPEQYASTVDVLDRMAANLRLGSSGDVDEQWRASGDSGRGAGGERQGR